MKMRYKFLILLFLLATAQYMRTYDAPTGFSVSEPLIENNDAPVETYFCPRDNCTSEFIEKISSAGSSIHCALFDLDEKNGWSF